MSKTEEISRGRGRPANFPGQKVIARLYKLPTETVEMVEKLAEMREKPLGVVLDTMIRRAFADATRNRSTKAKETKESETAAA